MERIKRMKQTNWYTLAGTMAALAVTFCGCAIEPVDADEELIAEESGTESTPNKPGEPTPLPWVKSDDTIEQE